MSSLLNALDATYKALAKPPVPCGNCRGWVGGRCEFGADWRDCARRDKADAKVHDEAVERQEEDCG